ncbi:hypothetical protein FOQG_18920 [Fusarium oxysporum f. sp. raphani 54005]|uniref:BED-type domain-containing protein n=1 Tax=Fusarium oxysporum f. sp. raphani 54005 TaxID=1089458 RepID=X0C0K6_FUSOX|nr:hypothetical protein FOQG_18920 [Fusarium oxysporum f. sp. raphani 54005]
MASADSSSVSVNDHDFLSFTEKPTENLDTAGESPQVSESSSTVASRKRFRTPTATDIWTESRQPSRKEPERNRHAQKIWYCKRCAYSQTAHNRVRGHLRDKHYIQISEQPTAKKLDCKLRDRKGMIRVGNLSTNIDEM